MAAALHCHACATLQGRSGSSLSRDGVIMQPTQNKKNLGMGWEGSFSKARLQGSLTNCTDSEQETGWPPTQEGKRRAGGVA
jgi:hypothetical protein